MNTVLIQIALAALLTVGGCLLAAVLGTAALWVLLNWPLAYLSPLLIFFAWTILRMEGQK